MLISSCQDNRIFSDLGPSSEGSGFFVALMLLIISVNFLIVKKFFGETDIKNPAPISEGGYVL